MKHHKYPGEEGDIADDNENQDASYVSMGDDSDRLADDMIEKNPAQRPTSASVIKHSSRC